MQCFGKTPGESEDCKECKVMHSCCRVFNNNVRDELQKRRPGWLEKRFQDERYS
jgi:hypothetical protein